MTTSTHRSRRLLVSIAALAAPVAFVVFWWAIRDDLPVRIATHFEASGTADGYSSTSGFVLGLVAGALATAALAVGFQWSGARGFHALAAIFAGTAWLLAAAGAATLLVARTAATAQDARLPVWVLLPTGLLALAVGALVWWLLPEPTRPADTATRGDAPYRLRPHERAVWVGRASSRPLLVLGSALAVAAVITGVLSWWQATLPLGVTAVAVLLVSTLTVRVDESGLSAHYGILRWPRMHVDLARIRQIDATDDLRPVEWGGWGLRITPRGVGMIARGGQGLVVERTKGSDVAISVDDPQAAADLVLALQSRTAGGHQDVSRARPSS